MSSTLKKSNILTPSLSSSGLNHRFFNVDASGLVVGRIAAHICHLLKAKDLPVYTPNALPFTHIFVLNCDKIIFTGKKFDTKLYWKHTGFPGGIKSATPASFLRKGKAEDILRRAIKGMLPRGPLGRKMLKNVTILASSELKNDSTQLGVNIAFEKKNKKNTISAN